MASSINTYGMTQSPVSTAHQGNESVRAWVGRHNAAVSDSTPNGNTLTTNWPSASGKTEVATTRTSGESDADFRDRHVQDYLLVMIEKPPVP